MLMKATDSCSCRGCGESISKNSIISWINGPHHPLCTTDIDDYKSWIALNQNKISSVEEASEKANSLNQKKFKSQLDAFMSSSKYKKIITTSISWLGFMFIFSSVEIPENNHFGNNIQIDAFRLSLGMAILLFAWLFYKEADK